MGKQAAHAPSSQNLIACHPHHHIHPHRDAQGHRHALSCIYICTYEKVNLAYPSQIFFSPLWEILSGKKSSFGGLSTCPYSAPTTSASTLHPQPSPPPPPTLLPWVSPSFQSQPRPRIILNPSPPPLRPCMKGRMEYSAGEPGLLSLPVQGVGWGEVVRGLSTLALKQQQLVQRKKRAREGGKNTGRWGRRRGNGGKGNERERIISFWFCAPCSYIYATEHKYKSINDVNTGSPLMSMFWSCTFFPQWYITHRNKMYK